MDFRKGEDLLKRCEVYRNAIHQIALKREALVSNRTEEEICSEMRKNLAVMREAVGKGLHSSELDIRGKIIGGEAKKMKVRYESTNPICGYPIAKAVSFALGVMEVNASMGRIVAAPTAGSCGVLPGVLFSLEDSQQIEEEKLVEGLFTASAVGIIIAKNATLAGEEGGCQAEVGSAAAMAAAAAVEIMGGTPSQALHAAAIALKNLMGLICDPIAGLVEAPCSKRNGIGAANALLSAEMALAGIESVVPFDEVVDAMSQVGKMMPCALRETSMGGIAATPTGKKLMSEILSASKTN